MWLYCPIWVGCLLWFVGFILLDCELVCGLVDCGFDAAGFAMLANVIWGLVINVAVMSWCISALWLFGFVG